MGWTGQEHDGRPSHEIVTEEIEWHQADQPQRHRVVARAGRYYAIETIETGDVWGLVALIERDKYWVYTKLVDETMGPYERECPKRILDMLTPLPEGDSDPEGEHNYAAQWRRDCYAYAEHKKTQPKLKPGDTVRFPTTGVTLTDGRTIREMVFKGKYRFEHRGQIIRMSKNWKRRYTWEVVT